MIGGMKLTSEMTDDALLKVLGARLASLRLSKNLTQQQLAEQARLGLRTLQRLELGTAALQLSGFLRVCRTLGLVERLEVFIPETTVSPIAQLRHQGRARQRASGRPAAMPAKKKWAWGDTK